MSNICPISYRSCTIEDPVATALHNFRCNLTDLHGDFRKKLGKVQDKISALGSPLAVVEDKLDKLIAIPRNPSTADLFRSPSRNETLPTECEVFLVGTKLVFKGKNDLVGPRKLFECLAGPTEYDTYVPSPQPSTTQQCSGASDYSSSASGTLDPKIVNEGPGAIEIIGSVEVSKTKSTSEACTTTTTWTTPPESENVVWMEKLLDSGRATGLLLVYTDLYGNFIGVNQSLQSASRVSGIDDDLLVKWIFWLGKGEVSSQAATPLNKRTIQQLQAWGFSDDGITMIIAGNESDTLRVSTIENPDIIYRLRNSVELTNGEIEVLFRMSKPEGIKFSASVLDLAEAVNRLRKQKPSWTDSQSKKHIESCAGSLWRSITTESVINTEETISQLFSGCMEFGLDGGLLADYTADILAPIAAAVEDVTATVNAMLSELQYAINSFLDKLEALIDKLAFIFGLDIGGSVGGTLWDCAFKLEFNLGLGIAVVAELELAVDELFVQAYGLWGLIGLSLEPIILALSNGKDIVRDLAGGLTMILGIPCLVIPIDLPFCITAFLNVYYDLFLAIIGLLEKGSADLNFQSHAMAGIIAEMKVGFKFSLGVNLSGGFLVAAILTLAP